MKKILPMILLLSFSLPALSLTECGKEGIEARNSCLENGGVDKEECSQYGRKVIADCVRDEYKIKENQAQSERALRGQVGNTGNYMVLPLPQGAQPSFLRGVP